MASPRGGSRQPELFARSMRPTIDVDTDHRLVVLERTIDWTQLESCTERIRSKKLKSAAGRTPHVRALNGALVLGASRAMSYRALEDQIRYYAPARVLCGLTETDWTPDHNTIHDYALLLGSEGMQLFNEYAVNLAVEKGLADPSVMAADTTVQEAAIPYPNEMGLLSTFLGVVGRAGKRAGGALGNLAAKVGASLKEGKSKLREHRLFAKTAEAKKKLVEGMATIVEGVQKRLGKALEAARAEDLRGFSRAARTKLESMHKTMDVLLPQVRYWLRTGKVAVGKIINLHIPELYSVVRGKAGKKVEFGLNWGVSRIKGGYILLRLAQTRTELHDSRYCVEAVKDHKEFFGAVPNCYGYDRGGWSQENVREIRKAGVSNVGLAPRGRAKWKVAGRIKKQLVSERAQVEGCIGAVKNSRYGFNRPSARSTEMMGFCGQRAAFGSNLNKVVRGLMKQRRWESIG